MLFDPRLIFSAIWAIQLVATIFVEGTFDRMTGETYLAVYFAISSFLIGAQFCIIGKKRTPKNINIGIREKEIGFRSWIDARTPLISFLFLGTVLIVFWKVLNRLEISPFEYSNYDKIRIALVEDIKGNRVLVPYMKLFFVGVGLAIFLLVSGSKLSWWRLSLSFLVGTVSAVLTTGRLALLLFFIGASYALYSRRAIRLKGLAFLGCGFAMAFIFIAILLKKGSSESSLFGQIIWNIVVYAFGSLSAFNHFVIFHEPIIPGGAFLSNILRTLLEPFIGSMPLRPPVNPFVWMPLPTNTFTALFPVYHDMGYAGIILFFVVLGVGHQYLFLEKGRFGILGDYLYALSLYPLMLTFFEEAYFSSLGTWLVLLLVPILLKTWYKISILSFAGVRTRNAGR